MECAPELFFIDGLEPSVMSRTMVGWPRYIRMYITLIKFWCR